jgi:hypothetical protein
MAIDRTLSKTGPKQHNAKDNGFAAETRRRGAQS